MGCGPSAAGSAAGSEAVACQCLSSPDKDMSGSQSSQRVLTLRGLCDAGDGGGLKAARPELGAVVIGQVVNPLTPLGLLCKVSW